MTVDELPEYLKQHGLEIGEQLRNGTYQPQPVRRVEIAKPDGAGVRKLGIACVLDRFVQQAVLQVLQKRWDRSVVWTQWKRGRTRFRELRKRKVSKDLAAQTAGVLTARGAPPTRPPWPWLCRMPTLPSSGFHPWSCGLSLIRRTAVCGPACTVVWQGRRGNPSPYADFEQRFDSSTLPPEGHVPTLLPGTWAVIVSKHNFLIGLEVSWRHPGSHTVAGWRMRNCGYSAGSLELTR
jgi:hypothetical protein